MAHRLEGRRSAVVGAGLGGAHPLLGPGRAARLHGAGSPASDRHGVAGLAGGDGRPGAGPRDRRPARPATSAPAKPAERDEVPLGPRPSAVRSPRRHAVPRRRRGRPRRPARARPLAARVRARTASRSAGRPASRAPRPSPSGSPRCGSSPRPSPTGCRSCPGTGSAKLDETLELTQAAVDLGADIALVITPYYSRPTQDGLYEWYAAVARTFPDMPIVLYNVPIRTAVDVAPETVARLRRDYANVVGSRRRPRTSSTSPGCSTSAAATRSCGRASSCCACRCSPSAGSASSAPSPTLRPARSPRCTTTGSPASSTRRSTSTTGCTRSST